MKSLFRAAAVGALIIAAPMAAAAQEPATPVAEFSASTFSLSAYGEVRVAPDMATINIGVSTEAPSASQAMAQNAVQMNQVMAALRRAGIEEKNIQTSSLNLNAQYTYRDNEPPVLRGYQATNQVTVRVMDLDRLGSAIDAVVAAGSNQINGISFGLSDPTEAENQARLDAVKALRAKADLYAQATGMRISRLVNLSEGGGYSPPPPMPMPVARFAAADAKTSVSAGELSVRVDITGLYQVTPAR